VQTQTECVPLDPASTHCLGLSSANLLKPIFAPGKFFLETAVGFF